MANKNKTLHSHTYTHERKKKKANWQKQTTTTTNKLHEKKSHQQTSNANLFQNHIFCFIGIFALVSISYEWMWMSTRSMTIYVARFCDRLFPLSLLHTVALNSSHYSFLRIIRSFFCPSVYSFWFSSGCCLLRHMTLLFAWNWHKTWAILFICLLLDGAKNR